MTVEKGLSKKAPREGAVCKVLISAEENMSEVRSHRKEEKRLHESAIWTQERRLSKK